MGLRVSGQRFQLGESLRRHVEARVGAAARKSFDGGISSNVVLDHQGSGCRTDCTLPLTSRLTLHPEGFAAEAPGGELPSTALVIPQSADMETEEGRSAPAAIAETRFAVRTHSVSSAVVEVDLTCVPMVLFGHATSGCVNIVYRRPEGHIGWVDPSTADEPRPARSQ